MAAAANPIISNQQPPSLTSTMDPSSTPAPYPHGDAAESSHLDMRHGHSRHRSQSRGRSTSPAASGPNNGQMPDNGQISNHRSQQLQHQQHQPPPPPPPRLSGSRCIKKTQSQDSVHKLSAAEMQELMNSPESLPIAPAPPHRASVDQDLAWRSSLPRDAFRHYSPLPLADSAFNGFLHASSPHPESRGRGRWESMDTRHRSLHSPSPRTLSTPPTSRIQSVDASPYSALSDVYSFLSHPPGRPPPLNLNSDGTGTYNIFDHPLYSPASKTGPAAVHGAMAPPTAKPASSPRPPSPMPSMIPLPPMSLPTHLQLELAAQRPSPLYVHQSYFSDMPYESNAIKFERLKNVLLMPPYLERTLYFGALACLDAWLYTFTILPIRFVIALAVLVKWWADAAGKKLIRLLAFFWNGGRRLWRRGRRDRGLLLTDVSAAVGSEPERPRSRGRSVASEPVVENGTPSAARERLQNPRSDLRIDAKAEQPRMALGSRDPGPKTGTFRQRRARSTPSTLSAFHKADLLQGAVIACSSLALMTLDASRMYHFIRAQSAIKLYVIYNILEVGDRLLSALGQDILECLFSTETLSRNAMGRSKVLLPLGMFMLALSYNCLHSISLYYQVITLNVAVNSYSNALLTLLLSNQFVEIKSTVFKRFEKDNLFQLTCADIVERFHLWIMLLIIGMRNIVEVGGLSVPGAGSDSVLEDISGSTPNRSSSVLPPSFTFLPSWIMSGEVLSPFLIVIGSEMLVDTIKHAYVTKFNNIKPAFYSRTLDILCKDYYTNAFVAPSLTRRLGLAVIPLSCLFIRASIQTYHMFLSTHIPMPAPPSTQTSLSEESATPTSPAMMAALNRFDTLLRTSLGRATFGYPYGSPLNSRRWYSWTSDDVIAALTMVVVFFIAFLVLLMLKLLLGMVLLKYARNRYSAMKQKEALIARGLAEPESYDAQGSRVGGRADVEVGEDKRRWINVDKTEGLTRNKDAGGKGEYQGVWRYEMVAKRIW
ncbi:hypothetical protein RJ55_03802 [Drechmeria coniospora]|nr:hypothetical protein RJ55_03802 [Drechmeria coniospora]